MANVLRRVLPAAAKTRRVVRDFAELTGLVYFGYVSQQSDEHHIVRGLTVSNRHVDDHYCIGSYDGYDVVFVERSDTIAGHHHTWHIMEFDLKNAADLPHFFIGSDKRGKGFHELLNTKYPALKPLPLGAVAPYPHDFTSHFKLYAQAAHSVTFENLIQPADAETIGKHFKGLVVEILEDTLYLYSEKSHLSEELLTTMLKNGLWLARTIDLKNRSS